MDFLSREQRVIFTRIFWGHHWTGLLKYFRPRRSSRRRTLKKRRFWRRRTLKKRNFFKGTLKNLRGRRRTFKKLWKNFEGLWRTSLRIHPVNVLVCWEKCEPWASHMSWWVMKRRQTTQERRESKTFSFISYFFSFLLFLSSFPFSSFSSFFLNLFA